MNLPSGYTQLEYIQSSGTQYINTGFKSPSSGLKIALGFEYIADHSEETLFGSEKNGVYSICPYGNPEFYVGSTIKLLSYSAELNTRYNLVVEAKNNKLTTTWNEISYTGSYSGSLESTQDIYLFANHINNSVGQIVSIKLYECSMYANDVMTRNFIPCKNPSGVIGLYDSVNSVFYANAGTGRFIAGPEVKGSHKTLIDGTWYDLKAGKCLVGGTAYSVKNGRVLVNSTGYNIPFFIGKIFTVTLGIYEGASSSGNGWSSGLNYVTYNGVQYTESFEIEEGDSISIRVAARSREYHGEYISGYARVFLNGTQVAIQENGVTYTFTPSTNVKLGISYVPLAPLAYAYECYITEE